ncbi:MAG: COR domain-containing protein [Nostoc sp.]
MLHRLGLVLNFRDHPILKDTNVLKPNWVTEGIYALLSDENLKTKTKGIFTPKAFSPPTISPASSIQSDTPPSVTVI